MCVGYSIVSVSPIHHSSLALLPLDVQLVGELASLLCSGNCAGAVARRCERYLRVDIEQGAP